MCFFEDFNADHDPFDDYVTFGAFAQVNSSLWGHQLRTEKEFDPRHLNIKTLNAEADAIQEMHYPKFIRYAGIWHDYDACIRTKGAVRSSLSEIGEALFGSCETYGEFMRAPPKASPLTAMKAQAEYDGRIRRIAANKPLLHAIRQLNDLGFTSGQVSMDVVDPSDLSLSGRDRYGGEEEEKKGGRRPDPFGGESTAVPGGGSFEARLGTVTAARRRGRDDDDDDYDNDEKGSSRRARTTGPDSKEDKLFRRYLERQPHAGRRLTMEFDKIRSSRAAGSDSTIVAWRVMSDDLLGGSLMAAARKVSQKPHTKYPLTAMEKKALHSREWSNRDADVMAELHEADVNSVRWNTGGSAMEVYLDNRLLVTAELHQGSGALTLTSAYATLFKVTPRMVDAALNGAGTLASIDSPSDHDLVKMKGKVRFALLQHSVNMSYCFEALRQAAVQFKGDVKALLSTDGDAPLTADQARLVAALRKLVDHTYGDIARDAARDLGVAPCQLPLTPLVKALSALVHYLYRGPSADDKAVVRAYRKALLFLAPGSQAVAHHHRDDDDGDDDDEGGDEQAETSGVRTNRAKEGLNYNRHHALDETTRLQLERLVRDAQDWVVKNNKAHEASALRRGGNAVSQLGNTRGTIDFNVEEDIYDLYQHYVQRCNASSQEAQKMVQEVVRLVQLVHCKKPEVLGGADPAVVADLVVAEQFSRVHNRSALEQEMKWVDNDIKLLSSEASGTALVFGQNVSVVRTALEAYQREMQKRASDIEQATKDLDEALAEYLGKAGDGGGEGKRRSRTRHQKHPPGRNPFGHAKEDEVHKVLLHWAANRDADRGSKPWEGLLDATPVNVDVSVILALQQFFYRHEQNLANNAGFMQSIKSPIVRQRVRYLGDLGWGTANYLPQKGSGEELSYTHSVDADYQAVSTLLNNVPLSDCRLNDLFVQYGVEPVVGLMYFWPWIVALGCHACMVRDGDVGNVMYIEPDCLLSENGQQKLVFFHMSMYFKAMVLNTRALQRAYFVYCRSIEGGYNHNPWNPLDRADVAAVNTYGQDTKQYGKTLFVVPTHIDRVQEAEHMALPGVFPPHVSGIIPSERKTTEYEVADVLTNLWNWNWEEQMIDGWSADKNRRYQAQYNGQRFMNVIMSQAHQESFDANKKDFLQVTANKGVMGRNIYDGVMAAWNGQGRIEDKIGSLQLLTVGGRG